MTNDSCDKLNLFVAVNICWLLLINGQGPEVVRGQGSGVDPVMCNWLWSLVFRSTTFWIRSDDPQVPTEDL